MSTLHLRIITPRKVVLEDEVSVVTVPSTSGELSILPRHAHLLTVLEEGVIKIKKPNKEEFLAIGGGYLETNGKDLQILVSRAYGQDEIDEELTKRAMDDAKKIMSEKTDEKSIQEAQSIIRRSIVDLKLLKKRRRAPSM